MMDILWAIVVAVGIPYAIVVAVLLLWNKETPPERVDTQ
jgi:hypothetical protein